jgi:mRNA interferase HigB
MHVISRPAITQAIERHPDARTRLEQWWRLASRMRWENLHDVRQVYPSADQVGGCLVFNARGNRYRLIVGVKYADDFQRGTLWVKHFLTHAEYDEEEWKRDCLP